jgi:glycerophosphoryl diester phosphodiesterase
MERRLAAALREAGWNRRDAPVFIARAHHHGLLVHTWAFRNEQRQLAADYRGNPVNEYLQFYALGIDGVFSDFADTAFAARELFALDA